MTNQEKRSTENRQPLTREYQWSVTLKTIVNCRIETKPDDPHLTSPWSGIVDKLAESLSSPSPALLRERVRVRVQNLFSLSERCANRCLKARLIVELDSGQLTEEGAVAGPAAYRRTLTRASRLFQRARKRRAASPSPATERARDLRGAAPDLSLSTLSRSGRGAEEGKRAIGYLVAIWFSTVSKVRMSDARLTEQSKVQAPFGEILTVIFRPSDNA